MTTSKAFNNKLRLILLKLLLLRLLQYLMSILTVYFTAWITNVNSNGGWVSQTPRAFTTSIHRILEIFKVILTDVIDQYNFFFCQDLLHYKTKGIFNCGCITQVRKISTFDSKNRAGLHTRKGSGNPLVQIIPWSSSQPHVKACQGHKTATKQTKK